MNSLTPIFCGFALLLSAVSRAEETTPAPAPRRPLQESLALLKQAAPYTPPAATEEKPALLSGPDSDVVQMDPVIVTESLAVRQLRARIDEETRKLKEQEYSIVRGGTLYRSKDGRIELGTWGAAGGLTFLRIRW